LTHSWSPSNRGENCGYTVVSIHFRWHLAVVLRWMDGVGTCWIRGSPRCNPAGTATWTRRRSCSRLRGHVCWQLLMDIRGNTAISDDTMTYQNDDLLGCWMLNLPFSWIMTTGFLYLTWRCSSIFFKAHGVDVAKSIFNPNSNCYRLSLATQT
jgi:hypothetical protein